MIITDTISEQFAKDFRIAEIQKNIADREEKIFDLKNNISSAEILEEEVEVNGELMVLFSIAGNDGVAVAKTDIESGAVTREQAYRELCGVDS